MKNRKESAIRLIPAAINKVTFLLISRED